MKAEFVDIPDEDNLGGANQMLRTSEGQYRNTPLGRHHDTREAALSQRPEERGAAINHEEALDW